VRIDLRYGAGFLPLEIPQRFAADVVTPRTIIEQRDLMHEVNRTLESPPDSEPLSEMMKNAETVAVVVNSEQDVGLNRRLLDILLGILETTMTDPGNVTILFSSDAGTNAKHSDTDRMLGEPTARGHHLLLHDANEAEALCYLGDTATYSTPVTVNRALAEADFRIGIGTIRCNVFVGSTGGRMSVMPHACGFKTIARSTKLQATHPVGPFMIGSAACVDMDEISRIANLDFILNAVPDWQDNIAAIIAGEPYRSWSRGVNVAKALTEIPVQHRADIAVVSPGGESSDSTLYDAVDSLYAAHEATEYGGTILLVAECVDGPGRIGFLKGVSECKSASEVEIAAETGYESGMEKARFFWSILASRSLIICSRLRESLVTERLHGMAVRDPQEGLELARSKIVSTPRVAVIPQGNRTLPVPRTR
jgi:nickel-dependent lactate racemase